MRGDNLVEMEVKTEPGLDCDVTKFLCGDCNLELHEPTPVECKDCDSKILCEICATRHLRSNNDHIMVNKCGWSLVLCESHRCICLNFCQTCSIDICLACRVRTHLGHQHVPVCQAREEGLSNRVNEMVLEVNKSLVVFQELETSFNSQNQQSPVNLEQQRSQKRNLMDMFKTTLDNVSEENYQRASKYRKIVKDKVNTFTDLVAQSEACAGSLADFENQPPENRGSIITAQIAVFDEIQRQKILCEKVSAKYVAWEKSRFLPDKEKEKILAEVAAKLYTLRQPDVLVESFPFEKGDGIPPTIFIADGELFVAHQKSIDKYCVQSGILHAKRTVEHEIWKIHVQGNDVFYATERSVMKLDWENETSSVFLEKYSLKFLVSEDSSEYYAIQQIRKNGQCDAQNNGILEQLNSQLQTVCELPYTSKWNPDIALSSKFVAIICYNQDKTASSLSILKRNLSSFLAVKVDSSVNSDAVRGLVFLKPSLLLLVTCATVESKKNRFSTKFTVFKIGNRTYELAFQGVLQLGTLISDVGYCAETEQVILCAEDLLIRKIHLEAFF